MRVLSCLCCPLLSPGSMHIRSAPSMPFVAFVLLSIKMTAHQGWVSLCLCAKVCVCGGRGSSSCPLPSALTCLLFDRKFVQFPLLILFGQFPSHTQTEISKHTHTHALTLAHAVDLLPWQIFCALISLIFMRHCVASLCVPAVPESEANKHVLCH